MEAFPQLRFILLGDSSQRDPYIYASIAEHFPNQVHAIYIRDVYKKNRQQVQEILERMEKAGIPCCFFTHSSDAILHSQRIGLIPKPTGNMQSFDWAQDQLANVAEFWSMIMQW